MDLLLSSLATDSIGTDVDASKQGPGRNHQLFTRLFVNYVVSDTYFMDVDPFAKNQIFCTNTSYHVEVYIIVCEPMLRTANEFQLAFERWRIASSWSLAFPWFTQTYTAKVHLAMAICLGLNIMLPLLLNRCYSSR